MCFLKVCFFQIKPRSLLFRTHLGMMRNLYEAQADYGSHGDEIAVIVKEE
jgi:hypothetical protein